MWAPWQKHDAEFIKTQPTLSSFVSECIHLRDEGIWVRSQSRLKVLYWAVLGVLGESVWLQSGGPSEISNGIACRYSAAITYLKYTGYKSFLQLLNVWFFFPLTHTLTLKGWRYVWDWCFIKEMWSRSDESAVQMDLETFLWPIETVFFSNRIKQIKVLCDFVMETVFFRYLAMHNLPAYFCLYMVHKLSLHHFTSSFFVLERKLRYRCVPLHGKGDSNPSRHYLPLIQTLNGWINKSLFRIVFGEGIVPTVQPLGPWLQLRESTLCNTPGGYEEQMSCLLLSSSRLKLHTHWEWLAGKWSLKTSYIFFFGCLYLEGGWQFEDIWRQSLFVAGPTFCSQEWFYQQSARRASCGQLEKHCSFYDRILRSNK